ncbi:hypothetical protein F4604DRAFT_899434 [Suillus subluteus]|nr:hypothetical protein F4604DRAFT_899434 [Suillus subluteus]
MHIPAAQRANLSQQSLFFSQLSSRSLQIGPLAMTDIIDAVNATIKVRKKKRIVYLEWYGLPREGSNDFFEGWRLVTVGRLLAFILVPLNFILFFLIFLLYIATGNKKQVRANKMIHCTRLRVPPQVTPYTMVDFIAPNIIYHPSYCESPENLCSWLSRSFVEHHDRCCSCAVQFTDRVMFDDIQLYALCCEASAVFWPMF